MDKNIEKATKQLDIVNQWISNCDTKSSFLLTFYGVIITIIFSSDLLKDIRTTLTLHRSADLEWQNIRLFLSLLVLLFFLFSIAKTIFHIYHTLRGRVDPTVYTQAGLNTYSLLFFQTVSKRLFQNFESENNTATEGEYLKDLNSQTFINSNIAAEKFNQYNQSLQWVVISFLSFVVYVLLK